MVKVIGPMFSLDAQGNLGNSLNFCLRNDINIVRTKASPVVNFTGPLTIIHGFMRDSIWTWQHLPLALRADWNTWSRTYRPSMSGYNSFTSYYMFALTTGQVPDLEPNL